MGFIFGVLIFSALISVIFGKRIGALFATGILGVAAVGVALCSIAFLWFLVANGFWSSHPTSQSSSNSSYGSTPAYGSTTVAQTPVQTPTSQTSSPTPTYQKPSSYSPPLPSSPAPATGTGPRLGIDIAAVPEYTVQQIAYLHVPPGAGTWISVQPNSPAENAGLKTYDVILSAGTQSQPADWITPSNQLPNYLDRVGYNVPVRLHVYRATEQRDFWVWAYPR